MPFGIEDQKANVPVGVFLLHLFGAHRADIKKDVSFRCRISRESNIDAKCYVISFAPVPFSPPIFYAGSTAYHAFIYFSKQQGSTIDTLGVPSMEHEPTVNSFKMCE